MKKLILLAGAFFLMASCSKDDSPAPIPADEKLLESATIGGASVDFEYNPDKTVSRVTLANQLLFDFNYSAGRIETADVVAYGQSAHCVFSYDANGKINGVTVNDSQTTVEYDAAGSTYTFYDQGRPNEANALTLNQNNDVSAVRLYQSEEAITILFDDSKKGPMANSNQVMPYVMMIYPDAAYFFIYMTRRPVTTISTAEGLVNTSNTYDGEDFITKMEMEFEDQTTIIKYHYTQL